MYLRTYRFADYGISSSHPFKLSNSPSSISGGSNGSNFLDITITTNFYYQCVNHSDMSGNLQILQQSIDSVNYYFYYNNINLLINNNFGLSSVYCYNHGYMGGENVLIYVTKCSTPVITLIGSNNITHEKGDIYDDSGVLISDATGEDLTSRLVITGDVSDNHVGSYNITYSLTNRGNISAVTKTRVINVEDTRPPIITLVGDASINHERGELFTDPGAIAIDPSSDDVSEFIIVTGNVPINLSGTYTLTYNVSDACGNTAIPKIRTIIITDNTPPLITLYGDINFNHQRGDVFNDPGYIAYDNNVENITNNVTVFTNPPFDKNTLGVYIFTYSVTDNYSNSTSTTRTVTVYDDKPPTITLLGDASMNHQRGDVFTDPGAQAFDSTGEELTQNIIVTGEVSFNVLGIYTLVYNVSDIASNLATTVIRTVNVFDNRPPTITLLGNASMNHQRGDVFTDPGAEAFDTTGEELTQNIIVTGDVSFNVLGIYTLVYDVSDVAGNFAPSVTRTITVYDDKEPTIILIGDANYNHERGDVFEEPGFIAFDLSGEFLTENVVVTGDDVCGNLIGTYTLIYNVSDIAGNSAPTIIRTVTVADTKPPIITIIGNNTINHQRGTNYIDSGATAADTTGEDLTLDIDVSTNLNVNVIGNYQYIYSVSDAYNNIGYATRTIVVYDDIPPTLTLTGDSIITHERGIEFIDPGATASDLNGTEDLTNEIVITTDLCFNVVGTYSITYDVSDVGNNFAPSVTRTVIIEDTAAPIITLNGDKNIILYKGNDYIELGATAYDANVLNNLTNNIVISGDVCGNIIGYYVVNYDVSDNANNSTRVTRYVTVTGDYIVDSVIEVQKAKGKELWTSYNGISADGTRMVVGIYGEIYNNQADNGVLYSHDSGNTWNNSTISRVTSTLGLRAVCLSKNGIYSIFTHATTNMDVYYSSDGGMTYSTIGKPGTSYFQLETFINESGTIAIVTSYVYSSWNTPIFIGYIDKNNLSNTSWSVLYKSGWDHVNRIGANGTFTNIYLGMRNGVWIFNNSDTSKLTDVNYWTQSTNNNIKNINASNIVSSLDNRVIVIPTNTGTANSHSIWFSNDYGNNFYNMYNSELPDMSYIHGNGSTVYPAWVADVSPDGMYILLYTRNFTYNMIVYTPGDNGNYTKLGSINTNIFGLGGTGYNRGISRCTISNNGSMIVSRGERLASNNTTIPDNSAWVVKSI